jgi:hypothetical protein
MTASPVYRLRRDVAEALTTEQMIALRLAYMALVDAAYDYRRRDGHLAELMARGAARNSRRLIAAFGERRSAHSVSGKPGEPASDSSGE